MVEDDNTTPIVDDIKRLAQDDPEVARTMAAALAEVAPKQAAEAAAQVAPEQAVAAAAKVAPKRAAAAAARAAPKQAAEAAAQVAPEQAAEAAAEVAPAQAAAALADVAPAQAAGASPGAQRTFALLRLEKYASDDVQKAVVAQLNLLDTYYSTALGQAKQSFKWALISAGVGLVFFLVAVSIMLLQPFILPRQALDTIALISVLSGALVEVVAGINFYLFNKTNNQVSNFHGSLLETQRFLLANSICDSLEDLTVQTRAELVGAMAKFQAVPPKPG